MDANHEKTFEQALARLEQIVRALEDGNAPLESLIGLFDEGTSLVKFCTAKLDAAEEKVKILSGSGETLKSEDFGA